MTKINFAKLRSIVDTSQNVLEQKRLNHYISSNEEAFLKTCLSPPSMSSCEISEIFRTAITKNVWGALHCLFY